MASDGKLLTLHGAATASNGLTHGRMDAELNRDVGSGACSACGLPDNDQLLSVGRRRTVLA